MPLTESIAQNVKSLEDILANGKQKNPELWEVSEICISLSDVPIASDVPNVVIINQARTTPNTKE